MSHCDVPKGLCGIGGPCWLNAQHENHPNWINLSSLTPRCRIDDWTPAYRINFQSSIWLIRQFVPLWHRTLALPARSLTLIGTCFVCSELDTQCDNRLTWVNSSPLTPRFLGPSSLVGGFAIVLRRNDADDKAWGNPVHIFAWIGITQSKDVEFCSGFGWSFHFNLHVLELWDMHQSINRCRVLDGFMERFSPKYPHL